MESKLICIVVLTILIFSCKHSSDVREIHTVLRTQIAHSKYKTLKPSLPYKDSIPELAVKNLTMIGRVGKFGVGGDMGKLLRVLRFENITDAVERRYNLPNHIIAAMVMEESSGVDLLPNALGDGGFGLCHMQACVARDFGLLVYKNCNAMVCNGKDNRSCRDSKLHLLNHALELKNLIQQSASNRRAVIKYDERLQPILNLDAVGRMLSSHMDGSPYKNFDPFRTAIVRYAGKYNYKKYWSHIVHNMNVLANQNARKRLEERFNKLNKALLINGEPADFKKYMSLSQEQNYNYGLAEYSLLPYFLPKNSLAVLNIIRR